MRNMADFAGMLNPIIHILLGNAKLLEANCAELGPIYQSIFLISKQTFSLQGFASRKSIPHLSFQCGLCFNYSSPTELSDLGLMN